MASERRLAEIRERLAAATPGPWELYATGRNVIAITKGRMRSGYRREIVHWSGFDCSNIDDPGQVRANAALIAHAPSDLACLLDEIARLTRELEEARARLEQYQRLVVFADSVARARGDACGLCDALGRDDQPYQSHRAADLIAEAERALIARRGVGSRE